MKITWILEKDVFDDQHSRLASAAGSAGHDVVWWDDMWLQGFRSPPLDDAYVVFQGSLGCAARIRDELGWAPGAFCTTPAFYCSAWYESARPWLVHERWEKTTVRNLVENPIEVLERLGVENEFFVRPDSPLKPFSGRALTLENLSLQALDHGFYYDDEDLPVIVAPIQTIGKEWRVVIANKSVIASSGYVAEGRSEIAANAPADVIAFAAGIAATIEVADPIYILDVCIGERGLRLMELNPFSGADLYGCDRSAIVESIATIAGG